MNLPPKAKRYVLMLIDKEIDRLRADIAACTDEDLISDMSNDLGLLISIKKTLKTMTRE